MHVYLQTGTEDDVAAYFVTCLSKSCEMVGFTFSALHYPPQNLTAYLTKAIESTDVFQLYLGLVRQESRQAAAAIEQIQELLGAAAALRAALAITIFRMEVKQQGRIPDMGIYSYLIRDYPEAIALLESAMEWCLQNWGIRSLRNIHLQTDDSINPNATSHPSSPLPGE